MKIPTPLPCAPDGSRRRLLLALASCSGAAWLGACAERGPLRIGFIGGMSGRVADLGIGGRNGAQLAVEDINTAGGVDGRTLELVVRDDEQDNDKARARLIEIIEAGAAFVVGPMTSSVAVALVPVADERGIVLISPTSTTHELSGKRDAFFRVVPDAPTGAAQQADALLATGHRRLVTVADLNNRAFSQSWTRAAASRFKERGGDAVLELEFKSAPGVRYAELARQIADARADVVVFAANASDTALLCQQVRRIDTRVAFASSAWAGTEQFPAMGGRALEGALVAQYFDRASKAPAYLQFVERYTKRFGDAPGYAAVNGYDALTFGVQGLRRRAGATLLAAMQQMQGHDGLQRHIAIDAHGDSRAPMFLTVVRDGRFEPLATSG